jgi:hypothetical protein
MPTILTRVGDQAETALSCWRSYHVNSYHSIIIMIKKYLVYPLVCEKTGGTDADEATIERAREHLR